MNDLLKGNKWEISLINFGSAIPIYFNEAYGDMWFPKLLSKNFFIILINKSFIYFLFLFYLVNILIYFLINFILIIFFK